MLEKFKNFNTSEDEDEKLLEDFFKEKQKKEFIENWRYKLNSENLSDSDFNNSIKYSTNKIIKYRNLLMSRASIIIIFFFITISLVYIFKGPKHEYKYEYSIKGNNNFLKQMNDLASKISTTIILSNEENNELMELFKNSDYSKAKQTAERLISNDKTNDYYKKIAIISAIKLNQYNESYNMFNKYYIEQNETIPEDLIQLFEINKKMLKVRQLGL